MKGGRESTKSMGWMKNSHTVSWLYAGCILHNFLRDLTGEGPSKSAGINIYVKCA